MRDQIHRFIGYNSRVRGEHEARSQHFLRNEERLFAESLQIIGGAETEQEALNQQDIGATMRIEQLERRQENTQSEATFFVEELASRHSERMEQNRNELHVAEQRASLQVDRNRENASQLRTRLEPLSAQAIMRDAMLNSAQNDLTRSRSEVVNMYQERATVEH